MEREPATPKRIELFLRELGKRYRGRGRLYLVGGTQIVFAGYRGQTEHIDYTVALEGDDQEQVILPRLETESLRVDEADFRRKFEAFLRLADERETGR